MAHRLVVARAARTDLLETWTYIAEHDMTAADRVLDDVYTAARRIAEWPEIGRRRDELVQGVRSLPVGNLVIFYRFSDDVVEVVRVLDGRRDLDALL